MTAVSPASDAPRQFMLTRWGLIPSWAEAPRIANCLIKARTETVSTKPGFRRVGLFRPDGALYLEILEFPEGKGDPKWHRPTDKLFLGIDHTAIVVGDTDASLKFYRDILGLRVVGESENYGPEQEHLNNVFGARLRITTLRAATGPAIEFLEYFAPRGGRSVPADARANDILHWQTRLGTNEMTGAAQGLRAGKAEPVSSDVITIPDGRLGFGKGLLVRDPDGHVLQLTEE